MAAGDRRAPLHLALEDAGGDPQQVLAVCMRNVAVEVSAAFLTRAEIERAKSAWPCLRWA